MGFTNETTQAELVDEQRRAIRSLDEKRAFRRHLSVYSVLNLAFWLSWAIGGLREEWLAPWPLVPTAGWGVFLLYRAHRLGGRKAISRGAMHRDSVRVRQLDLPALQDRLATRPVVFTNSVGYRPIRPFHLREIIDARERDVEEPIVLRYGRREHVIDLRERRRERASIRSTVKTAEADDTAKG